MRNFALLMSTTVHGALVWVAVFGAPFLDPPSDDAIEVVDAEIISSEEFAALSAPPPSPDAAPPAPVERLASLETVAPAPAAPPPPSPEPPSTEPAPLLIEEAPPLEAPEVDAPTPLDAPYDAAPAAPIDFAFDERALTDLSADSDIRAELPPVRVSEAETLAPDASSEAVAEVDAAPDPAPKAPPPQPSVARVDAPPEPDAPDSPPEPEPEPEPEVAEARVAPDQAAAPSRRPPRPQPTETAERAEEDPEQNEDWLAAAAAAVAQHRQTTPVETQRSTRNPRAPTPLSTSERDGLRFALRRCWSRPDIGRVDPRTLVVTLQVELDRNGWIERQPVLLEPTGSLTIKQESFYRSALGALQKCQPFSLPPEKYDAWARLIVDFDPLNDSADVQ